MELLLVNIDAVTGSTAWGTVLIQCISGFALFLRYYCPFKCFDHQIICTEGLAMLVISQAKGRAGAGADLDELSELHHILVHVL